MPCQGLVATATNGRRSFAASPVRVSLCIFTWLAPRGDTAQCGGAESGARRYGEMSPEAKAGANTHSEDCGEAPGVQARRLAISRRSCDRQCRSCRI